MEIYRHGDLVLRRVRSVPKNAKPVMPTARGYVLAEGEATGHAHTIDAVPGVEMYERDGVLYLRVMDTPREVRHEEHNATKSGVAPMLPVGDYVVPRQRVWDSGVARRVID